MGGIAAIAICAAFTSCSKSNELFDQNAAEQQKQQAAIKKKNADFTQSFTNRYGTIDSNNDWGFDNIGKAATRAAVAGRANAYSSVFTFPTAPADNLFATEKDGNAVLITKYESGNNFYIDNTINGNGQTIQPNGNNIKLYVTGDNVIPSGFYIPASTTLYLLPGTKLTLPDSYSFGQWQCKVYIAEGAELICAGKLQLAANCALYNRGTITTDQFEVTNSALFYNEGTIDMSEKTPGEISVENNNSVIVNDGTIKAKKLHTAGTGHVQNNADVTISGDTNVDSNNNTWVNNGQYTTNNFTFKATSGDVINNCKLTVIDKFYIGLGQNPTGEFKLDGSIITKDLELHGPANIRMTSNSVIKVSNTATMAITIPNYGIYGPASGDYAVFEAKNIVWESKNNFCVNYFGNLYVVADSHFEHSYLDGTSAAAQANGGIGEKPTYYFDPATVKMYVNGTDKPDYTIAESECNPGFEGNKKKIEYAVRIICEDLGASDDFDFNDVVFDALMKDGKTYIKVLAAGGTLPLTVAGKEVHQIFGVSTSTMVNTQSGAHYATKTDAQEFVVDQGWTSYKDIPVKVSTDANAMTEESMVTLKAEKGAAPQKIAVDTNFEWCDERQQIETKYTNFKEYVQKSGTRWQ